MPGKRVRRTSEEARRAILDAATSLLAEGGVAAVQVRAVAARVDMTDAGVTHHFGNRETLLRELLRDGGRRLRTALQEVLAEWLEQGSDLMQLVESLAAFYQQGYSELAVALHAAGWREHGSGMLNPLVEALHDLRPDHATTSIEDTRLAVAALHQAIAIEPLHGPAFRRSAGFTAAAAGDPTSQLRWWARQLTFVLGLDSPSAPAVQVGRRAASTTAATSGP